MLGDQDPLRPVEGRGCLSPERLYHPVMVSQQPPVVARSAIRSGRGTVGGTLQR